MDEEEIVWEDPPPSKKPNVNWRTRSEILKKKPGKWAKLKTYSLQGTAGNAAHALNSGFNNSIPKGDFEFVSRGKAVYGRYIGNSK
jgi:hypothetical protein